MEGWKSREDFMRLMLGGLEPLKPFYSEEKAGIFVGYTSTHYEDATLSMEAFCRPLWGLVPFWSGGGREGEFEEIYRRGIVAGTEVGGKEYWGEGRDFDQKFVEMTAIAYGMLMSPEVVWDPLSESEKDALALWLGEINRYECPECNWQFFCVMVNVALKVKGREYSREKMESGLEKIESYYIGDGWYTDGPDGQKDYYISFAMHFYGILYAMFMKEFDLERCESFIERAKVFAEDFIYWFSEDGESIPYGRSQTYRFAQVAFFSICAMAKVDVLPVGVLKGIIVRHLKSWWKEKEGMFDHAGLLTIGYKYPNLQMSEAYNAPGSPYWCMKAFAFLALPEEDEFWTADAEPMPKLKQVKTIKAGDMLIQRKAGHVVAFVPGRLSEKQNDHSEDKYSKFAYSTKYGFSIPRSHESMSEAAPDSVLAFDIGGFIFVKGQIGDYTVEEGRITTNWSPFCGIQVVSKIEVTAEGHKRTHKIISDYECVAYDCGFAVSIKEPGQFNYECEGGSAAVKNRDGFCKVTLLEGEGKGEVLVTAPNTNLISSKTAIPMVGCKIKKGRTVLVTEIAY